MWASCMFIHEMRLKSSTSVYIVEHWLTPSLLRLNASWQSFVSSSFFLSLILCHSASFCSLQIVKPVGGLIEDALLWGTKVILFRHYVSLSKADTLLKNYSPHWVPRLPTERLWKGLKGIGDTGRLPLSSHHCTAMWEAGVKSFIRSGRRCLQSPW